MRYPAEGDDLPNGDMPPGSSGLMTFEDAADVSAVANSAPSICPRRHPGDRGVSRAIEPVPESYRQCQKSQSCSQYARIG